MQAVRTRQITAAAGAEVQWLIWVRVIQGAATSVCVQGWNTPEDAARPGRGACTSGLGTSYMAEPTEHIAPASALLDITLRGANESRLQELYQLYMRKHATGPGPGEHEVQS